MSWRPGISIKRLIWISGGASAAEPVLSAIIGWACRLPASNWKLRSGQWGIAKYVEMQAKVGNLLGIVTAAEKGEARFGHKKTMTYDTFVTYVAKLDLSVSGYKDAARPATIMR